MQRASTPMRAPVNQRELIREWFAEHTIPGLSTDSTPFSVSVVAPVTWT